MDDISTRIAPTCLLSFFFFFLSLVSLPHKTCPFFSSTSCPQHCHASYHHFYFFSSSSNLVSTHPRESFRIHTSLPNDVHAYAQPIFPLIYLRRYSIVAH
ncbi:hypothetical protein BC835DRAFT_384888 [Cytidiella melzeri]|nr:hypothetical protein BC835DRAFT_384888 [Cytidiella melzeri]